jgi:hypothetical protein
LFSDALAGLYLPQRRNQSVRRHPASRIKQQGDQQLAQLAPPDGQFDTVPADLQRT